LSYLAYATLYTLTGPTSGNVHIASTNFTVALPVGGVLTGSVTVTPNDGAGAGAFNPASVILSTAFPSQTFTYTPVSGGNKTISTTNSGSLTNPAPITYNVIALVDGDPVSTWYDSSVNANHATMTGSNRPTFKTAIVNGNPIVRFTSAGLSKLDLTTPISGTEPWIVFSVMKQATSGRLDALDGNAAGGTPHGIFLDTANNAYVWSHYGWQPTSSALAAGFHILEGICSGPTAGAHFILSDGASVGNGTLNSSANSGNYTTIGYDSITPTYCDGDIAELIIYAAALSGTDRQNIEKYLGTKYGITVPAGTAVQPDTVTGLMGWWKADSLG
jgi:hypothetical protein